MLVVLTETLVLKNMCWPTSICITGPYTSDIMNKRNRTWHYMKIKIQSTDMYPTIWIVINCESVKFWMWITVCTLRSSFGMWTAFARWCHDWYNIRSNFIEGSMSNSLCLILEHQSYIYVLNLKQLINIYSLYIIYIYVQPGIRWQCRQKLWQIMSKWSPMFLYRVTQQKWHHLQQISYGTW